MVRFLAVTLDSGCMASLTYHRKMECLFLTLFLPPLLVHDAKGPFLLQTPVITRPFFQHAAQNP